MQAQTVMDAQSVATPADRPRNAAPTDPAETAIDAVVVVDFGSQYSQLIARRVREAGVYCELVPHDAPWERVAPLNPKGIILSGGPSSVYDDGAPTLPAWVVGSGLPTLGICYGLQLLAQHHGGVVAPAERKEYGPATVEVADAAGPLFAGLPASLDVWMSHGDHIELPPPGFRVVASSANAPIAAIASDRVAGIQFHPEVAHTPLGSAVISNFLLNMAGCDPTWTAASFIDQAVREIRDTVGDGRVLLGLSGGVDSSVAAALIHRAIGDRLTPVFVDHGLLRLGEGDLVREIFGRAFGMNLVSVDASDRFLAKLAGVDDPEAKRKIIGEEFVRVFEQEARSHGPFEFLAQGTLYPDVIESTTADTKAAAKIKTHHNVGGLPKDMQFKLLEPLKFLFKDEVRAVGRALGLPEEVVERQPFPGPGLAVRILGDVNAADLDLLRRADAVVREEIDAAAPEHRPWQYFAVLLPVRSVGVMGDFRTYGRVCAVRAVASADAMTADWSRLPHEVLARISNRIVNEVPGITRVVYDISSKPPATIEWE